MLRKVLKLVGYLLLIVFLAVTLAFSSRESRNVTCSSIQIDFNEEELIKISRDEIVRLVRAADNQLIGKELNQINAEIIEREVEKHQAILNAEVYKVIARDSVNFKGILGVRVSHRVPAVRVMSSTGSYYLDKTGEQIPVSANYAARVLVTTGYFSEEFARNELLPFVLFIDENPFWKAQIEQVHVEQNGNVLLIPLVGDHVVELGALEDFQIKLRNVKAFYEQVMARNQWEKYEQISVKYKNQVIAKKR